MRGLKPIIITMLFVSLITFFGCSKDNPVGTKQGDAPPTPAKLENIMLEDVQIADFNGSNGHARNKEEAEIRIGINGSDRSYAIIVDNATPFSPEIKIVEVVK